MLSYSGPVAVSKCSSLHNLFRGWQRRKASECINMVYQHLTDREYTAHNELYDHNFMIIKFVLGYGLVSCSLGYYVIELKNKIKNN